MGSYPGREAKGFISGAESPAKELRFRGCTISYPGASKGQDRFVRVVPPAAEELTSGLPR